MDLLPVTWPFLLPHLAQDGSALTRWASEGNECPFFVLQPVRPAEEPVQAAGVLLEWSDEVPEAFALEASLDEQNWTRVGEGKARPRTAQEIPLHPPVLCRQLRLRSLTCPVIPGISLLEFALYPAADQDLPAPVSRLVLQQLGHRSARLSWDPVPLAFLYRIHRLASPQEPAATRNLAGESRLPTFEDGGLEPGVEYWYRVLPETFSGNLGGSVASLAVTAAPLASSPPFPIRGVVEGFYNQPWTFPDRQEMLRFLGAADLNFYLYAPKVDGFHRALWREPYPEREISLFRELVRRAALHGVTFCYGLSPGLDFRWDDPLEPERVLEKLRVFHDLGVRAFCLLFDDTPDTLASDRELARKHVALVASVLERVEAWGGGPSTLLFVPTIYFKTPAALAGEDPRYVEYLEELSNLPPAVPVCWVGPGMPYSAEITRAQAAELAAVLRRRPLVWDNYPTTDNFFLFEPFLGPYRNRAPDLDQAVSGFLSNPMNYPNLSRVPLHTLARYLSDPAAYEPGSAFEEAVAAVGGPEGVEALRDFALQFYGHPVIPPTDIESPEFSALLGPFWEEFAGQGYPGPMAAALRDQFERFRGLPRSLARSIPDARLGAELREPALKLSLYGEAGLVALEILGCLHQGEDAPVPLLLEQLADRLAAARALPWKPGENHLHWIGAVLFESPPVAVDVIRGFLRRVRAMAEAAPSQAGIQKCLKRRDSRSKPE